MSRTTSIGRPRRSSTSSTKTAAGGSRKSRRSTSAETPTGVTTPGRISSHRNWLALARKLAGRYRRRNVSRRLGPLVYARIPHLFHRLLQSRRLMLFLSWPGPRGVVPMAGREIAAPPVAATRLPGATTLRRRVNRGTGTATRPSKSSPSRRAADASQSRWNESIGTVAASRAWKVDRSVAWLRAPSNPSLPAPRTVAAEATRFGGRTRQRRSRSEERRTGVTTVIERAASFRSQPEKSATSREEAPPLAPGSIPGAWETGSPQTIDVSRLTDEVLTQIDRRVVARRERFGRI